MRVRSWLFEFLSELIRKCRFVFIRKFGWVYQLVNSTLRNFHKEWQNVDLIPILNLIKTSYEVLGHGFSPYKSVLFTS